MAKGLFTRNYNGEELKPGEVMIPFEYTELDEENCTNPECIKTLMVGGKNFKVIYKAVPEEWAGAGKSALSLVQNEELGHYDVPNRISMDEMQDDYELALVKTTSPEDSVLAAEEFDETVKMFVGLMKRLIDKSAKIGYAVLLTYSGIVGKEFYVKMKLSHNPANIIRKQAESIIKGGIGYCDLDSIKCYKSRNDEEYREEAYKLLDQIIKNIR